MNDIEREVREMLSTESRRAPVLDEPPTTVLGRARRRRMRNGVGGAVILAGVVGLLIAGPRLLGATDPVEPLDPGVVPWTAEIPEGALPSDQMPQCKAEELRFTAISGQRAILEIDSGERLCNIPTFVMRIFDRGGNELILEGINYSFLDPTFGALSSLRILGTWSPCVPAGDLRFELELSNGGSLAAAAVTEPAGRCDGGAKPSLLRLDPVHEADLERAEALKPLNRLGVVIDAPRSVRAGSTLEYRITLVNLTSEPVPLDLCPSYTEALSMGPVERGMNAAFLLGDATDPATYYLNCAGAGGVIPGGERVTFAMRYEVAGTLEPGEWNLLWTFEDPAPFIPPSVIRSIIVEPAS